MNICNPLAVCMATFLLPVGGCSKNNESTLTAAPSNTTPPATGDHAPTATAPVSKPPQTRFERNLEKANAGDIIAQNYLGLMYAHGETKDDAKAAKWYRLAAEQGHASAQYHLGVMYSNGTGVPKDSVEALKWYHKSAERGHVSAQLRLASMYARGTGVPADDVEAYRWYLVFSDKCPAGHRDSIARQKEQLTTEQLAEAEKRAAESMTNSSRRK